MNTAGWLLTENGRQPWIVQGLMKTKRRCVAVGERGDVWVSLSVFTSCTGRWRSSTGS